MKASLQRSSPIRTVLVDGSLECLAQLEKWLGTLSQFNVVGKASSGVDALEQCKALQPDLVLMDVTLPLLSGYEATAQLKECGHCPTVILMSFFQLDEACGDDDFSKADAILMKDSLYEELIPTVTRLFPCATEVAGE